MKLLAFDVEISDVFEAAPGDDLRRYEPFHISVAATAAPSGAEVVWYSTDEQGVPHMNLTQVEARRLLSYLEEKQHDEGCAVCAWNGLNFDFRWLGFAAEDMETAARVALKSYDPMFQFFNQRGFPISLAKAAEGMGIEQKKLMHGADAPKRWRDGEYQAVMEYVLGDCQITNQIVAAILERREVRWVTARGDKRFEPMPTLKTVAEVIKEPIADQSWMDSPLSKGSFYDWIPHVIIEPLIDVGESMRSS
jgi:hypothetical protein